MTSTEIVELRRVIGQMRHAVSALRGRYGDVAAVQRLANDVERMDIDATELVDLSTPRQREAPQLEREVVVVPDTPYDESLWKDADDEGLGGYRNRS
jgi:Tfp pilus assembly protein PilN